MLKRSRRTALLLLHQKDNTRINYTQILTNRILSRLSTAVPIDEVHGFMDFLYIALHSLRPRLDDDYVERLNYFYSSTVILLFALTVSAKQWVGTPLKCWTPAYFTRPWIQYAENYCFVQNTYWLPTEAEIPPGVEERRTRQISYYQWVPFILTLQALMFYSPHLIWKILCWKSGIDIQALISIAQQASCTDESKEHVAVRTLSYCVKEFLQLQQPKRPASVDLTEERRTKKCGLRACRWPSIISIHLLVKLLYLLNAIGQVFFIGALLGHQNLVNGLQTFAQLVSGHDWQETGEFPRVTVCDFEVRILGNLQRHSTQCVLLINLYNEKIFLFLWFWCWSVALLNTVNFVYWLASYSCLEHHSSLVTQYLQSNTNVNLVLLRANVEDRSKAIRRFVKVYLQPDGCFVIRKLANNANSVIAAKVAANLFLDVCCNKIRNRKQESEILAA